MNKTNAKKRIQKAVSKLNDMDNKVCFRLEEDASSVSLMCESRMQKGTCFGAYCYTGVFDEYKNKSDAYVNCMLFAEMLIAATKLNDPMAYHNFA